MTLNTHHRKISSVCCRFVATAVIVVTMLCSCTIKDDIPYPVLEAAITDFIVSGQCDDNDAGFATATIDKSNALINVQVSDTVTLSSVRVMRMEVSNNAEIEVTNQNAIVANRFPKQGFSQPKSTDNTYLDFSKGEVTFTLHTYQDYTWKVRVHQVMRREVLLQGQVGDAIIDSVNHNIIVYVNASQSLNAITVHKFKPAGQHCKVVPDPTAAQTYDFSKTTTFTITPGNGHGTAAWQMFVYHTQEEQGVTATAFARCVNATVSGKCPTGVTPTVEFRRQGDTSWTQVANGLIAVDGSKYTAELTGLVAGGTYEYQVSANDKSTGPQTLTTVAPQQLENGSFDQWHIEGSGLKALYLPWAEGGTCYWDTGNHGATSVGASNSTYVTEGGRTFANLESKYIVIKFAAGNIFTGEYLETDVTNGVLNFGRPFTSFPTKLRFDFKYRTSTINRDGGDWRESYGDYITRQLYERLPGQPDSCNVYVALGDWDPVDYKGTQCRYLIRTRPSALHLMDMKDSHLIAFGNFTCGRDVSTWTTQTIDINYRVTNRQPKTIIVVASSSKYGDYFTGGEGSLLQIDNMELLYE